MFRKTTSNNQDKPTLWQEVFNIWEDKINILKVKITAILKSYPRAIYAFMIITILISLVCFFYLPAPKKVSTVLNSENIMSDISLSIGSIAKSAGAAKELIELQNLLEDIVSKDSLTQQDSMVVLYVFEKMQLIEKNIIKPSISDSLKLK